MGWNPFKAVGSLIKNVFHQLEKLPGSPVSVLGGINRAIKGELSWNPFGSEDSVWDHALLGSKLSKDRNLRGVGRTLATMAALYYGGPLVTSGFGEAAVGAEAAAGTAAAAAEAGTAAGSGAWLGEGMASGIPAWDSAAAGSTMFDSAAMAAGGAEAASPLDAWLNLNGLGPDTAGGSGEMTGILQSGGSGAASPYDEMLSYLKRKGTDYFANTTKKQMVRQGLGLYGLMQSLQNRKNFKMPGPGELRDMPGYQAGLDAVQASMAQQGYTGGSNAAAAIGKFGGDFYNQYFQQKMASSDLQSRNGVNTIGSLAMLFGG